MANSYQTLLFRLWDMALASQTTLCMLVTRIFYRSSPFPKESDAGMCRNARAERVSWGAEGTALSCQHVGISAWSFWGWEPSPLKPEQMGRAA